MGIDLTQGSNVFVLMVCVFLLLGWLVISRRLTGLLCCAVGGLMLFASVHSDGQPQTLLGILISGMIGLCLLLAVSAVLRARRRRVPVYVPVDKRRPGKSRARN